MQADHCIAKAQISHCSVLSLVSLQSNGYLLPSCKFYALSSVIHVFSALPYTVMCWTAHSKIMLNDTVMEY